MTELTERGKQVRRDSLKLGLPNGIYHWGGSFSVVEILIALYDHTVTPDDIVIMSKGHCWIPQVVILREKGLTPGFGPRLDNPDMRCLVGHPFRDVANGIHANTGSLGHGMPLAIGMAFAKKFKKEPGNVYCIVGDGEIQEGTFWESLLLANKFKLNNLIVIIDWNDIQGSGRTWDVLPMPFDLPAQIAGKLGWNASIINGHNIEKLVSALKHTLALPSPRLVTALTVKGRGVSYMEDDPKWHANYPSSEQIEQAYKELA